jgi:hypothetical protein
MPNREFSILIDDFKGINTLSNQNNLDFGEMQSQVNLVIDGKQLTLGKEISTADGAGTLPQTDTARWMKFWADSQDTWYCLLAIDDSTNTDLKYFYETTNPWDTNATFTDLFSADKTSTPSAYTVGGELRIGGSLTNYHKFIAYQADNLYRLGRASGDSDNNGYQAAGLYMPKGEIEYPNENSEISSFTATSQDSDYDFLATDSVEYGLTYTYDNAQESLMYTGTTDTSINAGQRVALYLKIIPVLNVLWRVTHINIYRSLNGGDYYLLTRLQVNDTGGTANYGELGGTANWAWTDDSGSGYGEITVYDTGAIIVDSYTSRTGFTDYVAHDGTTLQNENNLKTYFKVGAVCQGRAVVGNIKRAVGESTEVYNDRLYFSPVGRFDSFYKDDWVDLETGDGDEITALVNVGGKLVIFKENNMYIWNMGTRSELNWFREASFRGYGVSGQRNAVVTPYGVCFINKNGVYLYRGTGEPEELSKKIRPSIALTSNDAIGYDPINRRILAFEAAQQFWLIDIDDGYISRQSGVGSFEIAAFDVYNNKPYILDVTTDQVYDVNGTPTLISPTFITGDMNFGTERNKRIDRVRMKYSWTSTNGSASATIQLSNDYGSTVLQSVLTETSSYIVNEFYPSMYGRQFRLRLVIAVGVDTFKLLSIEIAGKIYRT